MPFPKDRRLVAPRLGNFCDRRFVQIEPNFAIGVDDLRKADSHGIAACEKCSSGWSAGGGCDIEVCEPHSLAGHSIQVRGFVRLLPIATQIADPHVVNKYDDHVWG